MNTNYTFLKYVFPKIVVAILCTIFGISLLYTSRLDIWFLAYEAHNICIYYIISTGSIVNKKGTSLEIKSKETIVKYISLSLISSLIVASLIIFAYLQFGVINFKDILSCFSHYIEILLTDKILLFIWIMFLFLIIIILSFKLGLHPFVSITISLYKNLSSFSFIYISIVPKIIYLLIASKIYIALITIFFIKKTIFNIILSILLIYYIYIMYNIAINIRNNSTLKIVLIYLNINSTVFTIFILILLSGNNYDLFLCYIVVNQLFYAALLLIFFNLKIHIYSTDANEYRVLLDTNVSVIEAFKLMSLSIRTNTHIYNYKLIIVLSLINLSGIAPSLIFFIKIVITKYIFSYALYQTFIFIFISFLGNTMLYYVALLSYNLYSSEKNESIFHALTSKYISKDSTCILYTTESKKVLFIVDYAAINLTIFQFLICSIF